MAADRHEEPRAPADARSAACVPARAAPLEALAGPAAGSWTPPLPGVTRAPGPVPHRIPEGRQRAEQSRSHPREPGPGPGLGRPRRSADSDPGPEPLGLLPRTATWSSGLPGSVPAVPCRHWRRRIRGHPPTADSPGRMPGPGLNEPALGFSGSLGKPESGPRPRPTVRSRGKSSLECSAGSLWLASELTGSREPVAIGSHEGNESWNLLMPRCLAGGGPTVGGGGTGGRSRRKRTQRRAARHRPQRPSVCRRRRCRRRRRIGRR